MRKKITNSFIILLLLLATVFTAVACTNEKELKRNTSTVFTVATSSTKIIDTFSRTKPEVKNGGLESYPGFDNVIKDKALREKIFAENNEMLTYDKIDSEGNLYILNENKEYVSKGTKLYKHSAADKMLEESIPDDAQGTVARVALKPSRYGNNLTQLYIPAGEVVTVVLDAETVKRGGIRVDIGLGSQRGGTTNIPAAEGDKYSYSRMPIPRKSLLLKETINYIGSPLGGTLYIMSESLMNSDANYQYEITVIGAVRSPEYYFGATDFNEWENIKKFPAPYFHLEVSSGIRLTMPASFIRDKSAEEMYNLGQFYENTARISNKLAKGAWFSSHPVDVIFDSYVFVGAAVAVVGADVCFCPTSWAASAVDYNSLMRSGSWGVLHEFNHHHQGWGATNGGEVTNNVANVMTYVLNTNIATYRTDDGGLGNGWNKYVDPYQSLDDTLSRFDSGEKNRELNLYTNLFHNLGEEFMYELAKNTPVNEKDSENFGKYMSNFYIKSSKLSGYNMRYYLEDICKLDISSEAISEITALNLPMFLPVASPYQTGVSLANNNWLNIGKPYHVPYGSSVEVDFGKIKNLPNIDAGIELDLSSANGKFKQIEGLRYAYTPSSDSKIDSVMLTIKQSSSALNIADHITKLRLDFLGDPSILTVKEWENTGYASIDEFLNSGITSTAQKSVSYVTSGVISTKNANTFGVMNGKLLLPKGRTKLVLAGDDMAKLVIKGKKVSYTAVVNATQGYKLDDTASIIDITLESDTIFGFSLYMLNKQSIGNAKIGMVKPSTLGKEKEIVSDITNDFVRHSDFDSEEYTRLYYTQRQESNDNITANGTIISDMLNPTVTIAPASYNSDMTPDKMLDGNRGTLFHSVTNLKFPGEVVIDFGQSITFNNIHVLPKQSGDSYGYIKDYEVYYSDNPSNFATLGIGVSEYSRNGFEINTPIKQARYIKIIVKSVHAGNYFAISEVEASMKHSSKDILMIDNENFNFFGDWSDNTYGNILNGSAKETTSGAVTFNFKGTALSIYGTVGREYGSATIRIDGKKIGEFSGYADKTKYNQCLFVLTDLADKNHTVEISNYSDIPININYMAVTLTGSVEKGFLSSPITIIIIVAVCISVLILALIIISIFVRKSIGKKGEEKQKHMLDNVIFVPEASKYDNVTAENLVQEQSKPKPIITKQPEPEVEQNLNKIPKEAFKPIIKSKGVKKSSNDNSLIANISDNTVQPVAPKATKAKETKPKVVVETVPTTVAEPVAPKATKAKETKPKVVVETVPTTVAEPVAQKATKAKETKPKVIVETAPTTVAEPVAPKATKAKETKPKVIEETAPTPLAKPVAPKATKAKETKPKVVVGTAPTSLAEPVAPKATKAKETKPKVVVGTAPTSLAEPVAPKVTKAKDTKPKTAPTKNTKATKGGNL